MATKTSTIVDPGAVAKMLPKKDSVVGKVKVKKQQQPKAKPDSELPSSPKSPLLNNIDAQLRATFETGRPMEDPANLIQCKHCKKPMLHSVANAHIKICIQKKNEKAQKKKEAKELARKAREAQAKAEKVKITQEVPSDDGSESGDKTGAKKAVKGAIGKKRKAGEEADKNPKKKTKKEIEAAKPKAPKPKGPVDVEKQCGVLLANGAMCARSLTCKSHAMGAKRAVPGRSQPYDFLLAAYQKKNQAKQQKAAMDANAPLPDEANENLPVDSDEEKDKVMAGIGRSMLTVRPLAQHQPFNMRKAYERMRLQSLLSDAFPKKNIGGHMAAAANTSSNTVMTVDTTEAESRRSSVAQPSSAKGSGPGSLPTPTAARKQSVATGEASTSKSTAAAATANGS